MSSSEALRHYAQIMDTLPDVAPVARWHDREEIRDMDALGPWILAARIESA